MVEVSVIVPVYNVEKQLRRCLDSLINQTIDSYEIICVNDCSPDGSAKIIKEYERSNPSQIKVITNECNIGLGLTRNRGIEAAQGEYILFVDSDDYVRQDYIETYLTEMKANPVDVLVGGYVRKIKDKERVHMVSHTVWSTVTYAIACAKMFRKSFLDNNHLRFKDIKSGEDILFSLSVYYYGASYRIIDYAGYYYVYNSNSITGSMNHEKNYEEIMVELFTKFCDSHDLATLNDEKLRVIEYVYLANMINALVVFAHGCGPKRMKEKYSLVINDLEKHFPDYRHNPYVGLTKPHGQTLKIRLGVGVVHLLHKIHLDKLFFALVSLIK